MKVAEWMGRREAWSAERTSDSRTKPTRWEFSKRGYSHQKLGLDNQAVQGDNNNDSMQKSVNIKINDEHIM